MVKKLDRHHLIPRSRHRNKRLRRQYDLEEMRNLVAWLCRPCHKTVHAQIREKDLALEFHTIEALRAHPEIEAFVQWVRGQPAGKRITVRKASHRRDERIQRKRRR